VLNSGIQPTEKEQLGTCERAMKLSSRNKATEAHQSWTRGSKNIEVQIHGQKYTRYTACLCGPEVMGKLTWSRRYIQTYSAYVNMWGKVGTKFGNEKSARSMDRGQRMEPKQRHKSKRVIRDDCESIKSCDR
jgi:hypothetical protein